MFKSKIDRRQTMSPLIGGDLVFVYNEDYEVTGISLTPLMARLRHLTKPIILLVKPSEVPRPRKLFGAVDIGN